MGLLRRSAFIALLVSGIQPQMPADTWDVAADTWVATDGLGRTLPCKQKTGLPRNDRTVAMFYFLWMGHHGDLTDGPYDISILRAENPEQPAWGPDQYFHHWGEPWFGYYLSADRFVIRKHLQMLSDAGVDLLIMDCTNGFIYLEELTVVFEEMERRKALGMPSPSVSFFANGKAARMLWRKVYQAEMYPQHWATWREKPLLLVKSSDRKGLPEEMEQHLTLRGAWGLQPIDEPKEWSFLQPFPQDVGYERDPNIPEFMSVSVAQQQGYMSDENGFGRSAINRIRTTDGNATFEGRNFQQQWDRAHTVDPEIVFITGWNEWVAQRFIRKDSPAKFVDQWTTEYSRDLEPLKGDHEDAYYYQLVSNIRRFKGVSAAPEPLREHAIVIDGFFEDWNAVRTEYRDDREDPVQRDHAGWGRAGRYTDQSGRNDIVRMKATESGEFLYLLIETSAPLTPSTDEDWMVVYLDVDADASTGWLGYDLAIRSYAGDGTAAVVPLSTKENATSGNGSIFYQTKESQLELAIPKAFLGPVAKREIHVKVTDNIPVAKSPRLFTLKGDAAPNDRFSYRIRFSN